MHLHGTRLGLPTIGIAAVTIHHEDGLNALRKAVNPGLRVDDDLRIPRFRADALKCIPVLLKAWEEYCKHVSDWEVARYLRQFG